MSQYKRKFYQKILQNSIFWKPKSGPLLFRKNYFQLLWKKSFCDKLI